MKEKIDETKSICPECKRILDATIWQKNEKVVMTKFCPKHGKFESIHPFASLNIYKIAKRIYEDEEVVCNSPLDCRECNKHKAKLKSLRILITPKCNLNCPFCFEGGEKNRKDVIDDFSLKDIQNIAEKYGDKSLSLVGGEPTVREDLPQMIGRLNNPNNSLGILTNGIKTSSTNYVNKLEKSGIEGITLSHEINSEGFEKLRGQDLTKKVNRTIKNLSSSNISFKLSATVTKESLKNLNRFVKDMNSKGAEGIRLSENYKELEREISKKDLLSKVCKGFSINWQDIYQQFKFRFMTEKLKGTLEHGEYRNFLCHIPFWFKKSGDSLIKLNRTFSFNIIYYVLSLLTNKSILKILNYSNPIKDILKDFLGEFKMSTTGSELFFITFMTHMNSENIDLRFLQNCPAFEVAKTEDISKPVPHCFNWK